MSNGYTFSGKHVWIIGASSGIGKALAEKLAEEGAILALSARSGDKLEELNRSLGGHHLVCTLDVTQPEQLADALSTITKQFPYLDSCIFLAGTYAPAAIRDMQLRDAQQIVDVNLKGALYTVHTVLPYFQSRKTGQLALCGSVAGYRGLPNGQPYSATKAAIMNLAESLMSEEGEWLDVKLISPGFVETPMTDKNDFTMPMMISPKQAADAIAKGLAASSFEIHFPKRFTLLMKMLRVMPAWLYFRLMKYA